MFPKNDFKAPGKMLPKNEKFNTREIEFTRKFKKCRTVKICV